MLKYIANANCEFLYCDIGTNGGALDGSLSLTQIINYFTVISERMVVSRMEEFLRILNFTKEYCMKNLIFPYQGNLITVQAICHMCL